MGWAGAAGQGRGQPAELPSTRAAARARGHGNVTAGGEMELGEAEPQRGQNPLGGAPGSGVEEQQLPEGAEIPKGSRKVGFSEHSKPFWTQASVPSLGRGMLPALPHPRAADDARPWAAPGAPGSGSPSPGLAGILCLFGAARLGFQRFWHDSAPGPCSLALHLSRCKSSQVGEGRQGMRTEPGTA